MLRSKAPALLVLAWMSVHAAPSGEAPGSLYERLGGQSGIEAIATTLIERVAHDPRLGRSFEGTNLRRIERHLADQLCELARGPCHYSGDSMKEVHAGLHISQAEFYGMVAVLEQILKERHVDLGATNALLERLAPMKREVVEPAGAAVPAGLSRGTP